MAKVINRKGKLSGSSKRSLNRAGKKAQKALNKGIKKATKSIKKGVKNLKNSFKVGNATVRKVNVNSIGKAPGSSKNQILPRRAIAQRNIDEDKLREIVSSYAKAANRRLRSLEKSDVQNASAAYRQIRTYSRDNRSFMGMTKNGEFKFRTDVKKMDKETLQREAMELDTFLFRARTSTVRGVKEQYKKIKDAIGRQDINDTKTQRVMDYFNNMSMEEFNEFWENQSMSVMIEMYGSDEVIKLIQEGEDKGLDLEKMNELFTSIINNDAKTKAIRDLERAIQKDIEIEAAKGVTGYSRADDTLESTEPVVGVDEDGFMTLY